jgi:poly(3-hydroxybutyrate) depolymerase
MATGYPFRCARALIFLCGLVLYGQDASLALRTSVTYNTQKATLPLSEEQRREADQLGREAQQAALAHHFDEAIHDYYHGLAVMRNVAWTPAFELASSLQARLDHAMVEPGRQVTLTLSPLYPTAGAAKIHLKGSLFLVPSRKGAAAKPFGPDLSIDGAALPFSQRVQTPDVADGDYTVEVRLEVGADAVKPLPIHFEALSAPVAQLRKRVAKTKNPNAEYAVVLYDRADSGEVNPARFHFRDEFAAANAILDAAEAGRDPFAGKHGDLRKAYLSAVDNSLQPYRLFVPQAYDGQKPTPLVVALHGMGGDENTLFEAYNNGQLKREAERLGFLVVCPKGRDTASMYRDAAEQDVMDVLAEVRRDYKVDANRIYLMGHSMGGYGTWSIAMAHPDIFAALGPISGGGNPLGMLKIKSIPEYVVHGDDDRTVPVTMSRVMVQAGKAAGAKIVYVEVPGGSHVSVAAPQFGPMLDFFAAQERRNFKSSR